MPSHISKIVLSIVKIGPPEEARTPGKDRCAKDHRAPSHISKMVLSTVHFGPPEEARTPRKDRCGKVHRAPSHISKTVPPTIHLGPETLKKIQSQLGPNDRLLSW